MAWLILRTFIESCKNPWNAGHKKINFWKEKARFYRTKAAKKWNSLSSTSGLVFAKTAYELLEIIIWVWGALSWKQSGYMLAFIGVTHPYLENHLKIVVRSFVNTLSWPWLSGNKNVQHLHVSNYGQNRKNKSFADYSNKWSCTLKTFRNHS